MKLGLKIYVQIGDQPHQKRTFERMDKATARTKTFPDHDNPSIQWNMVSYYREKLNVEIKNPDFPLVKIRSGREVLYPLEFCWIAPGQLFQTKRQSREQAELIRYIGNVKPNERFEKTNKDFQEKFMAPEQKSLLERFGISIDTEPLRIDSARVLPPVKLTNVTISETSGLFKVGNYSVVGKINQLVVVSTSRNFPVEDGKRILTDLSSNMAKKGLVAKRKIAKLAFSYEQIEGIIMQFEQSEEEQNENRKNVLIFLLDRRENDFYGNFENIILNLF